MAICKTVAVDAVEQHVESAGKQPGFVSGPLSMGIVFGVRGELNDRWQVYAHAKTIATYVHCVMWACLEMRRTTNPHTSQVMEQRETKESERFLSPEQ